MAGAKIISLVDVKLREEMVMRDTVLGELMAECTELRDLIDALHRDIDEIKCRVGNVDQLKQGGGTPASSAGTSKENPD